MTDQHWQIISNTIQALTVIATFTLSYMVYRLAHLVATGESVRSINDGWSAYNTALLDPTNLVAFNAFLKGNGAFDDDGSERKEHLLLYLLLNSLSNEHYSASAGTLDPKFADCSLDDYMTLLEPRAEYVLALMRHRGYDHGFIDSLDGRINAIRRNRRTTVADRLDKEPSHGSPQQ